MKDTHVKLEGKSTGRQENLGRAIRNTIKLYHKIKVKSSKTKQNEVTKKKKKEKKNKGCDLIHWLLENKGLGLV